MKDKFSMLTSCLIRRDGPNQVEHHSWHNHKPFLCLLLFFPMEGGGGGGGSSRLDGLYLQFLKVTKFHHFKVQKQRPRDKQQYQLPKSSGGRQMTVEVAVEMTAVQMAGEVAVETGPQKVKQTAWARLQMMLPEHIGLDLGK